MFKSSFLIFIILIAFKTQGAEKPNSYQHNKQSIVDVAKIYLAYEARHQSEPRMEAALKLPRENWFVPLHGEEKTQGSTSLNWIYPLSLGLEIKIGSPQMRVVVIAPEPQFGRYLIATEDLKVHSHYGKDIQRILDAIEKRSGKIGD